MMRSGRSVQLRPHCLSEMPLEQFRISIKPYCDNSPLSESPIILRAMRNLLRKIPANPRQEPQHHLLHLRGK